MADSSAPKSNMRWVVYQDDVGTPQLVREDKLPKSPEAETLIEVRDLLPQAGTTVLRSPFRREAEPV